MAKSRLERGWKFIIIICRLCLQKTIFKHALAQRKLAVRAEMFTGLPTEIEGYTKKRPYSKCGNESKVIGKRSVRTEVEFEPEKLKVRQIVHQAEKCTICGLDGLFCCHLQLYRLEPSISSSHFPSFPPVPDKVFSNSSTTLNAPLASTVFWIRITSFFRSS